MKFQFVNNNGAVDGAARKQIRSHVAMGRNAGRKLSRPSRKKLLTARTTTTSTAMSPLSHSSPSALPAHWQQHQDAGSESLALIQGGEQLPSVPFFLNPTDTSSSGCLFQLLSARPGAGHRP